MKDIAGYEGKYAVTKNGEIWAYPRPVGSWGRPHVGMWLKLKLSSRGYLTVCLRNGSKRGKYHLVHRLVARTYLGEPQVNGTVNHKNGIKTDNRIENLEWCSQAENNRHWRNVLGGTMAGINNPNYRHGRFVKT